MFCRPCRGLALRGLRTHGWRRGLRLYRPARGSLSVGARSRPTWLWFYRPVRSLTVMRSREPESDETHEVRSITRPGRGGRFIAHGASRGLQVRPAKAAPGGAKERLARPASHLTIGLSRHNVLSPLPGLGAARTADPRLAPWATALSPRPGLVVCRVEEPTYLACPCPLPSLAPRRVGFTPYPEL